MKSAANATKPACRVALAALGALALAGCGEIKNTIVPSPGTANQVTVELAGAPDAFDAGVYEAQALGYFRQSDLNVRVAVPSAGEDPVTMLHDGRVLVALSSEANVLLHRNEIQPVVSIAAIVHAPLPQISIPAPPSGPSGGAALTPTGTTTTTTATTTTTKRKTTKRERARAGKTATTRSRVAGRTGTTTTVLAGSTTSATGTTPTSTTPTSTTSTGTTTTTTTTTVAQPDQALWPASLQQLLSAPGYPTYDGLVVVVRKETIVDDTGLLRRFVQALARGYRAARSNPSEAISNLIDAAPALAPQRAFELSTLEAAIPHFFPPGLKVWGYERQSQWNAFGAWMTEHRLLSDPNAITDASTNELLQGQGI